jgi:cyclopropane-fatty-acyl-phospholipid synthase
MTRLSALIEKSLLPDPVLRFGIRRRVRQRLRRSERAAGGDPAGALRAFRDELDHMPIAVHTDDANQQHYELPAAFFERVLGPRLKYSCCWFDSGETSLAAAEVAMLDRTGERAELADGQSILDLGCGWGSLSLYFAERFPASRILGVSNSASQREYILDCARRRGLANLDVVTADINSFTIEDTFDRVVSIEMFEHMKNYRRLLARIAGWLNPGGKLFVHIFSHRNFAYHYQAEGPGDWMARHFFTGGTMPAHNLLPEFQDDLRLERDWVVDGAHYRRTADTWLANMDDARVDILPILKLVYGAENAGLWWGRWRLFFMACAELFGYANGTEWQVSHYRFIRRIP